MSSERLHKRPRPTIPDENGFLKVIRKNAASRPKPKRQKTGENSVKASKSPLTSMTSDLSSVSPKSIHAIAFAPSSSPYTIPSGLLQGRSNSDPVQIASMSETWKSLVAQLPQWGDHHVNASVTMSPSSNAATVGMQRLVAASDSATEIPWTSCFECGNADSHIYRYNDILLCKYKP